MQMGQGVSGMQTMNQSLYHLHSRGAISIEEALGHSDDVGELQSMIEHGSPVPTGRQA